MLFRQRRPPKVAASHHTPRSVAGAATATATAPSAGEAAGGVRSTARAGGGEDRELDRGFVAGALRAGDFLLLIDDNSFKALVAFVADVFVDRHEAIPS